MQKIRVGVVQYLNSKPLVWGIRQHAVFKNIDLVEDYPSSIAKMLMDDKIDVGLVPVAIIPQLKEAHVVTDYGIACDGAVASVGLFSNVPVWEIEKVYLDYQSETSIRLAQLLLKDYWKREIEYLSADEDYIQKIGGSTAGVIIGDRALAQQANFKYFYDLGADWKAYTGLPFVFAAWVANKPLPHGFLKKFDGANALGVQNIDAATSFYHISDAARIDYLKKNIHFYLDSAKRKGLELFLKLLHNMEK